MIMRAFLAGFILFALTLSSLQVQAQDWEGGLFLGFTNYQGDLVVPSFTLKELNYGAGLVIRHNLNRDMALRGNLLFGKIDGRDDNWSEPAFRQIRNFEFESPITELSLTFEYSPFGEDEWFDSEGKFIRKLSPYGFAGLGVTFWDPDTDFNLPVDGSLPPGATQAEIDADRDSDFSTTALVIPIGAGVKYDITDKIIEFAKTNTTA